jgi:HD-GYP domain-containing protein (c-di-GMP phosphodiesterase class II)
VFIKGFAPMAENNHRSEPTGGSVEEFLQISPNILATFPARTPVALYEENPELNRTVKVFDAETLLSRLKKERVTELCDAGNLFLARKEYTVFARHLSRNLGALLTEHDLDESEAAAIFFMGIWDKYQEFLDNPARMEYEALEQDMAVFCEYLWADPARWLHFFHALSRENSLADHGASSLFVGMALYLQMTKTPPANLVLNKIAMGLLVHDLGMSQMPKPVLEKDSPLVYREKTKIKDHVEVGLKMLNRLRVADEEILICMREHHERLDGSGYPKGMRSENLSDMAKVCAVADSFCAMVARRYHQQAQNPLQAALILLESPEKYDIGCCQHLLSFLIKASPQLQQVFKDKAKVAGLRARARAWAKR